MTMNLKAFNPAIVTHVRSLPGRSVDTLAQHCDCGRDTILAIRAALLQEPSAVERIIAHEVSSVEGARYGGLTRSQDMMAACLGAAYKAAQMHSDASEARADAVWNVKDRIVNELRLDDPRFDSDRFIARVQYWYEAHNGF